MAVNREKLWWKLALGVLLFSFTNAQQYLDCQYTGPCSCKSDQGVIDLSPLDGKDPNNPRFSNIPSYDGSGFTYSYNPCSGFSAKCYNTDTAVCQTASDTYTSYLCGTQSTAVFVNDPTNGLTLKYTGDLSRVSEIQLICEPNTEGSLSFVGELTTNQYSFTLTSKYACPSKGPPPTSTPAPGSGGGGLSVGSVLCILLLVFSIVYLIVGMSFNKFYRGADGKEIVPNLTFWTELPSLVREGFVFTIHGCKASENYAAI